MLQRRRWLFAALAGLLPATLQAQNAARPARIGWLATYPLAMWVHREVFAQAMRELGWSEGSDYVIDLLAYEGRSERLPALAAELVRRAPDVIVASATPTVAPLMQATRTIPIVFVGAADPVGSGFVASMNRPGGNVTGLGGLGERLFAKNIEWLSRALPRARRLGLAHNPDLPIHAAFMPEMDAAAQQLGVQLHKVALRTPDELAHALASLAQARVEGVFLVGQPWHANQAARVAALCQEHRLPAIGLSAELTQAGLLMSYGWKGEDQARRLPYYLDRILKGAAPAELPVEQPTRLYLRLNLKTARTLGLELPHALRVRADEVIE
jgi:putative ABC transport system substrate-binding protein